MDSCGEQYVAKSAEEMDEERQQQVNYFLLSLSQISWGDFVQFSNKDTYCLD